MNEQNKIKIKRDTLFIIGYLLLFIQFWTRNLININEYVFYIPAFFLIVLSINLKGMKKKEIAIILFLNLIGIVNLFFSKSMNILKITILLSAMKNRNFDKIMKITFWTSIIIMFFHFFYSTVIDATNLYREEDFGRGIIEKRYYFGFSHANNLQLFFNIIIISWLYTYFMGKNKKNKYKFIYTIIIITLSILMYTYTKSRTGLIISLLSVLVAILYSNNKIKLIKKYRFINFMYITIVLTILITIFFLNNTRIYAELNEILTGRLKFANMIIQKYGLNLFGTQVSEQYETIYGYNIRIIVDQGIISSLLTYGIIINMLFYIYQLKLIKKYCIHEDYRKVMLIVIMIIYAITENVLFYPFTNIGLLMIADLIYNRREK